MTGPVGGRALNGTGEGGGGHGQGIGLGSVGTIGSGAGTGGGIGFGPDDGELWSWATCGASGTGYRRGGVTVWEQTFVSRGCLGYGHGIGHGSGLGGPLGWGRATDAPRLRLSLRNETPKVTGHLPPEVIQRVVRQNHGRMRACYQEGLVKNPGLGGRVSVRFVIARDGSVPHASNAGSDLPDTQVTACVVRAFYGLSFPAPEGGIVTVTYPLLLTSA